MPKLKQRAVFTTEMGRVICKDGKPFIMIAVPGDFFTHLSDGNSACPTQAEADAVTGRIAELLSEYGLTDE